MDGAGSYTVNASSLSVITDTLTSNLEVIIPFGLGITAIMIGVGFIPKLIKKFVRG